MDETTTTPQDVETQAVEIPQPESQETQAVQDETIVDSPNTQPAESTDNSDDPELMEWASKKGISTEDPVKLLKMVRESESKMHQATNEASKLRDTVQTVAQDEGQDDVYQLINRLKVTEFYLNNPEARNYDDRMAALLDEKPFLAGDLQTLYDLARFKSADEKLAEARQAGRTEALKQAKKSEIAAAPKSTASTRQISSDEIPTFTSVLQYEAWKSKTGFDPFEAPN
jgi:hypothetical protein